MKTKQEFFVSFRFFFFLPPVSKQKITTDIFFPFHFQHSTPFTLRFLKNHYGENRFGERKERATNIEGGGEKACEKQTNQLLPGKKISFFFSSLSRRSRISIFLFTQTTTKRLSRTLSRSKRKRRRRNRAVRFGTSKKNENFLSFSAAAARPCCSSSSALPGPDCPSRPSRSRRCPACPVPHLDTVALVRDVELARGDLGVDRPCCPDERVLDVVRGLGAGLQENEPVLLGEGRPFLRRNGPAVRQVGLVADQHDGHGRVGVRAGVLEPRREVVEGLPTGDVVDQ